MKNVPPPFPWSEYSRKLMLRIETPYCIGSFDAEDAESRAMHLAKGFSGSLEEGNYVILSWLVDPTDGVVIDARFQAFGDSALLGGAEVSCELVVGKNYDQAGRLTADHIEKYVRDKNDKEAFPKITWAHLNLIVEAIGEASGQCQGLPLPEQYIAPPVLSSEISVNEGGWPGWQEMTLKEKLGVLEHVISQDIRPYIELDAGGVEVLNVSPEHEVLIAYQGSCTSCFSATGATLSYIQHVLRAKIWPEIIVTPNL